MNYRSALLKLWIVASIGWIGWWTWHYTTSCDLIKMAAGHAITCRWEAAEPGGLAVVSQTEPALTVVWNMAARTIGIPAIVILVAIVVFLAFDRFRGRVH